MQVKSLSIAFMSTALVGALAGLSLPVLAQDAANLAPAAAAESGPVATLALAHELYEAGVASGDALTVLTAAKLATSVAVVPGAAVALDPALLDTSGDTTVTRKKAAPGAPAAPAPVMKDGTHPVAMVTVLAGDGADSAAADAAPLTAEDMFATARDLAGDDPALLALIEDAAAETSRGAIGGAQEYRARSTSGQTDVWEIAFEGNSYAEISVQGSTGSNLDMVITDENGNVICYEASPSDQVYCDFIPAWDGYFYVTVQNTGDASNPYLLLTN